MPSVRIRIRLSFISGQFGLPERIAHLATLGCAGRFPLCFTSIGIARSDWHVYCFDHFDPGFLGKYVSFISQMHWIRTFRQSVFTLSIALEGLNPMTQWVLETTNLSKEFKGFLAVSDVDIRVRKGHIHALIGPNGAGKTTVFNLLTKFITPTSGKILFNGVDITDEKPADIALRGIVRSFQISAVFPNLTPFENVRVALQRRLGITYHFWKPKSSLDFLNDSVMELLEAVGLQELAHRATIELAYGQKRALEIATTLALEPEMMLLDEPTQGMGAEDVDRITELVRSVAADRTILMVEHNLKVVEKLADRITVLNRGAVLAEGDYNEISGNSEVMEAYMGSEHA